MGAAVLKLGTDDQDTPVSLRRCAIRRRCGRRPEAGGTRQTQADAAGRYGATRRHADCFIGRRAAPYAVIDKNTASLVLYDAKGKPVDQVPVLIGIAAGDDATPGVGSKKLGEIGPAEKTTPAGRFLAKFGYAAGRQRVLWVDYTNSVAIHAIPTDAAKREKRRERILSPATEDNRITFGCINLPRAFYGTKLRPLFEKKGGYVYVLPDTKPLEETFPRLRVHALTAPVTS
jgi:hypothetical protein